MYEGNMAKYKGFTKEADNQEEIQEQEADVLGSDRTQEADDKITDVAVLDHCRSRVVNDHIHWLCDEEVYLKRLTGLLRSKQVVELDADSSVDE